MDTKTLHTYTHTLSISGCVFSIHPCGVSDHICSLSTALGFGRLFFFFFCGRRRAHLLQFVHDERLKRRRGSRVRLRDSRKHNAEQMKRKEWEKNRTLETERGRAREREFPLFVSGFITARCFHLWRCVTVLFLCLCACCACAPLPVC